jgi:hypothetical protein
MHLNPHLNHIPRHHANEEIFIRSLLMIAVHPLRDFPSTTYLDADRLRALSFDLSEHIFLTLTLDAYTALCGTLPIPRGASARAIPQLREALPAIATHRWQENRPYLALEIARAAQKVAASFASSMLVPPRSQQSEASGNKADTPDNGLIAQAEETLERYFSPYYYQQCARAIEAEVGELTMRIVKNCRGKSPLELFYELASPAPSPPTIAASENARSEPITVANVRNREEPRLESVARRLAHIGILQWRVWGEMVYLSDDEASDQTDSAAAPMAPTPTASPVNRSSTCTPANKRAMVSGSHSAGAAPNQSLPRSVSASKDFDTRIEDESTSLQGGQN